MSKYLILIASIMIIFSCVSKEYLKLTIELNDNLEKQLKQKESRLYYYNKKVELTKAILDNFKNVINNIQLSDIDSNEIDISSNHEDITIKEVDIKITEIDNEIYRLMNEELSILNNMKKYKPLDSELEKNIFEIKKALSEKL